MSGEVRRARGAAERQAARALRIEVFAGEQGVLAEAERSADDDEALHLLAAGDDSAVLGTCRLVFSGAAARLGRLVVRRDARRRGIATALLAEAEREARAAGAHLIVLNAQTAAEPLYERAGYVARGERFVQEGIEHVTMRKELPR